MKKLTFPVDYSPSTAWITFGVLVLLAIPLVMMLLSSPIVIWPVVVVAAMIILICCTALFYAPLKLTLTPTTLSICRSLRIKEIPVSSILSVSLHEPSPSQLRICASGGFLGYWGIFSEKGIGKYFGYYAKHSDCFLLTLRDGHKYLLGCRNPQLLISTLTPLLPRP